MLIYFIICPLVFLAGFVDAIAGGGGLISLPAYMIAGLPAINAIATNKMSSCMGTSLATAKLAKARLIPWKQAIFAVLAAFAGSTTGARIALMISDYYFKLLMLIVLPLTAAYVLFGKGLTEEKEPFSTVKTTLISVMAAFFIGIYDGFYGPGTGTFLILLLTALAHLDVRHANGLTKAINLTTNIAALTVYFLNGKVLLPLGLIAGCFNIAGNYLGIRYFTKGGGKSVKPFMVIVLTIFLVKVITELFF